MSPVRRRSFCLPLLLLVLLSLTACAPAALEPAAQTTAAAPTAPALAAYPVATATLPPYPWPTATPGPTYPPEPTGPPEPTDPPVPTLPPTPVVTPIPTTAPPFIPFPEGTTPQPFTLYWRDGDVLRSLRTDEGEPRLFLDPAAEFGLYLPPAEAGIRTWGDVSPDGGTLALVLAEEPQPVFTEDAPYPVHIYLLDQIEGDARLLVKNGLDPVWSPDGRRIAYRSTETGGLWVADAETGAAAEVYKVDKENEHVASQHSWAGDSRHLVFMDEVPLQSATLMTVDADQLEAPSVLVASPSSMGRPQWSPTSDTIAFAWTAGEGGTGPHIWTTDANGREQKQLTFGIRALSGWPLWSKDGNWIAFSGLAEYESATQYDLWLISADGLLLTRATFDNVESEPGIGVHQSMPLLSPDGTQLLFFQDTSAVEESAVWILSLIDGSRHQVIPLIKTLNPGLTVGY